MKPTIAPLRVPILPERLALHRLMIHDKLRIYHTRTGGRDWYVVCWYHGPCPALKKARIYSDITIIKHGQPHRMKYIRNERLMTVEKYYQMRKATIRVAG